MALPTYNKDKRRKTFQRLPKDAYVIKIKSAREEENRSGSGSHLAMAFDIAEGEYKDFYQKQFESNTNEDKKWPADAVFYLNIPDDNSAEWAWTNYNTFFADLEDSNNGYVFGGDAKELKGKLIGGKFYIQETEYNGKIYQHTRMRWTCIASDVREGKAGQLPNDDLKPKQPAATTDVNGYMDISGTEEELPF